jgi:D-amino-acid dehydrogenase
LRNTKAVAVVGAGIAGLTAAYYLAKEGYQVIVYEQERYPAMKTSFANGGQVSVSNSEVWTTWSNVKKGFKWMFKKDAPLLIRPRLDWAQWKWMTKFLYYTATGAYEQNTKETIKLGLEATKLYREIGVEEGMSFDQSPSGILHFYKDPAYYENAKQVQSLYRSNGVAWDILGPMQTAALERTLGNVDGIVGGAWTWHDWTGDIHKFCYQLAQVLEKKYNVKFCYNDKIESSYDLEMLTDCYDTVVVAAGVGSEKLANKVGDSLGIYPVKGYSITINNVDKKYLPTVSLLDDQAKIVTSTLGNRFRVAGTAELAGENYDIRRDRIQPLLDWVHTNFPNINTHDYTQWACLRPMTPNMMPIVRQSKKNNKVFYHAGHGHLGWTLAPATAKQVVELIKNAND